MVAIVEAMRRAVQADDQMAVPAVRDFSPDDLNH